MCIKKIILLGLSISSIYAYADSLQHSIKIEHWTSKKGTEVYFVAAHEIPMLDIEVVLNAGSARDGENFGLAELTNTLISDGTIEHDENQIAKIFDDLGAQFGLDTGRDMASLSLRTLVKPEHLQPALNLMNEILTTPAFPSNAFVREQKNTITSITLAEQDPMTTAINTFYKSVYGQHPYAHPVIGTKESINKINLNEIKKFYKKYYVAKNSVIAMVGDVSRQQAEQIVEQVTANLPVGTAAAALPLPTLTKGTIENIAFPSQQNSIVVGQLAVDRTDPNYFPLYVGNSLLGGDAWTSLLFKNVREERGLSYSVYSYMVPLQAKGIFVLTMQTKAPQTQQALQVAKQTLQDFIQRPVDTKLLEITKKSITGSFPLRLASNSSIVNNIAMIGFYHLPLNYLDTFNSKVNAVTAEDIHRAFAATIKFNDLNTIVVGTIGDTKK